MLSNQDLDRIAAFLTTADSHEIDAVEWNTCISIVEAELTRRRNGPYTLAEAILSERPFAEIDTEEPTPWIICRGGVLYVTKQDGGPTSMVYVPMAEQMCEPMFKLKPEVAK